MKKELSAIRQPVEVLDPDPALGLTSDQVALRIQRGWRNVPQEGILPSEGQIIALHCFTFFNLVFLVLAALLWAVGSFKNMTFLIVAAINTVIGIVQEIRAKRAVQKLTLITARPFRTVRDGRIAAIPSGELVRDDIVIFGPGDQICADARVCSGLVQVNESLITGEADTVEKTLGSELRSGSFVVAGTARARLTHISGDAYAARLSREAKEDPRAAKSEMMRSLDKLIQIVGIALVPIGGFLFWQEFVTLQLGLRSSVEATVAALVGMIPEGLYLLTSIAMAASALKLAGNKVLVQDMNCIETLARVDVLCVDKTGTITEPEMTVEEIIPLCQEPPAEPEALLTAMYAGREPDNDTARALALRFSGASSWVPERWIPFDPQFKWSGAVFRNRGAFLVGAPECILGSRYREIAEAVANRSGRGYRVLLAAAYNGDPQPGKLDPAKILPLALVTLTGRIRPQAEETFRFFARQGVSVKVISGDDPVTVSHVACRAGIENAGLWVDARELETDADYRRAAQSCTVFGRVTPDKKKRLIQALKNLGHTVAMTGDGVNDVLALRQANCGIAMASGAQAASQVAQLVLTESDFSAMPHIVGEGRRVINNIQRAAALFLVKNIFSLGLALITLLTGWPYPLVPIQLTAISALTIGIPSFFLAMEPNYERVTGSFLKGVLRRAFPGGLTNIFVVLAAQAYMTAFDMDPGQTGTVCAAVLGIVGMLVLYQVCRPFGRFRRILWCAMGLCLVACFTVLGGIFDLHIDSSRTLLIIAALVILCCTVFTAIRWLFDLGDALITGIRRRRKDKHADL